MAGPQGAVDPAIHAVARAAAGFMPDAEGLALHQAALSAPDGLMLEIGTYCAKSTCYLGAAAQARGTLLVSVDHHRGSEENQPGEQYHDPALVDAQGRVDTLGAARATIAAAGLEGSVALVVGSSPLIAQYWRTSLALLFLDGGHSPRAQHADYDSWAPHLMPGALLLIHDVFPNPADGGRPPYEVYCRALEDGYTEVGVTGSLRVLRRA